MQKFTGGGEHELQRLLTEKRPGRSRSWSGDLARRKRNDLRAGPPPTARAAGPQGTSAPGALPLWRQLRVTRASTEGALRIGSPSPAPTPAITITAIETSVVIATAFQSRLWLWPGLGLGMAAPLRLVVPSATSIVAKREYGVPAGLSGLARHIF